MGRVTIAMTVLVMGASLAGCKSGPAAPAEPPPPAGPLSFPADWVGDWAGPARLLWPDGRTREFRMELHIAPTSDPKRCTWRVVYADAEQRQERAYELVTVDAAAGRFEIDERNGIALPATLIGGTLRTAFTVQGVQVMTCDRLERAPDGALRLTSEMLSLDAQAAEKTGGGETPEVATMRARTLQSAVLVKGSR